MKLGFHSTQSPSAYICLILVLLFSFTSIHLLLRCTSVASRLSFDMFGLLQVAINIWLYFNDVSFFDVLFVMMRVLSFVPLVVEFRKTSTQTDSSKESIAPDASGSSRGMRFLFLCISVTWTQILAKASASSHHIYPPQMIVRSFKSHSISKISSLVCISDLSSNGISGTYA